MMAKENGQKSNLTRVRLFYCLAGLITVIFLVALISVLSLHASYKSYDKINRKGKTIDGTSLFQLTSGEYFIFIYSSDETKVSMNYSKQKSLEPYVVNYFDFCKQNNAKYGDEIIPIVLMDVAKDVNQRCLGSETSTDSTSWTTFSVDKNSLPVLVDMSVGSTDAGYSYQYKVYSTKSEIQNRFQKMISLIPVSYLPVDEEKRSNL